MTFAKHITMRPAVQVIGDVSHPDFRDAMELLRADAQITSAATTPPELIVVAQSRPGSINSRSVDTARRTAPLAGIVALVGSWGEGETRTGKPWPGVERLYWYEFPTWWRRQIALRAAGHCPAWSHPAHLRFQISHRETKNSEPGRPRPRAGLVVLKTPHRESANALADILHRAGYATAWQPNTQSTLSIRGALAGIWNGGQLNDHEANDLSQFCRHLSNDGAPVVALLDFPRRDRVNLATKIGASAVLGKPWINIELTTTLQAIIDQPILTRAA